MSWPRPRSAWSAAPLSVDGNDNLSRKKIEAALSIPEKPREMSPEDWEDWVDEAAGVITELYGETGYLDAAVKIDPVAPDTAKAGSGPAGNSGRTKSGR